MWGGGKLHWSRWWTGPLFSMDTWFKYMPQQNYKFQCFTKFKIGHISKWVLKSMNYTGNSVQFSSVAHLCLTLCNPMNWSTPCLPVHHQLLEPTKTHVHQVTDAIQLSHPLSSPSPPAFTLSQHQGLFQWISYSRHVAKILEFQYQHQSFQWIFRIDYI